jgi:hypothetical protein
LNVHQVAQRQPFLLAFHDRRRRGDALAEHIFAIETILNITATASAEIFAALFALLALARPCTPFTRYIRNAITDR